MSCEYCEEKETNEEAIERIIRTKEADLEVFYTARDNMNSLKTENNILETEYDKLQEKHKEYQKEKAAFKRRIKILEEKCSK